MGVVFRVSQLLRAGTFAEDIQRTRSPEHGDIDDMMSTAACHEALEHQPSRKRAPRFAGFKATAKASGAVQKE